MEYRVQIKSTTPVILAKIVGRSILFLYLRFIEKHVFFRFVRAFPG